MEILEERLQDVTTQGKNQNIVTKRKRLLDLLLYAWMKKKWQKHKPVDISKFKPEKVRNILVVSSTAIGDTLLSTPAIRAVRRQYPQARIVAHISSKYKDLFANNPDIDQIVPYCGGYKQFFKTIKEFRKHCFDAALIFHGNGPQAIPMAYLSSAPFILRYPVPQDYGFLLSHSKEPFDYWKEHVIIARLKTAELIGCSIEDTRMVLSVEDDERDVINNFLSNYGVTRETRLVGFQSGASDDYKKWPAECFSSLGRMLLDSDQNITIILTGSPAEKKDCGKIVKNICAHGKNRVINAAGALPLRYLKALVERLDVLVTNDTGTMHVAIALGTKTVSLFCPTLASCIGPIQDMDRHIVIQKPRPCDDACIGKKCNT
ncbi:MAG: glycosyltransferase family 9 protein, partial [Pseudomonadota bacterium]